MNLTEALMAQLEPHNVPLERFRDIVGRMYAAGIMVRDEDGVEQRLYDDMRRIEAPLAEYFGLAGDVFFSIDTQLRDYCHELGEVAQSLRQWLPPEN